LKTGEPRTEIYVPSKAGEKASFTKNGLRDYNPCLNIGGYGINESIEFAKEYQKAVVDVFHISSGGKDPIGAGGRTGTHAGYQVPKSGGFIFLIHKLLIA